MRELDCFIQKDVLARAAFLQSLQGQWDLFDARVTQYRVLPPLLTELRTPELQPLALPLILNLAERQTSEDFSEWTLPHLAPLLATATGHTLGTILKSTAAFADRVPSPEIFELYVLPAVLRGVVAPEVLVQEEALRQVIAAAHKVTPETLRISVVPLLHRDRGGHHGGGGAGKRASRVGQNRAVFHRPRIRRNTRRAASYSRQRQRRRDGDVRARRGGCHG